HRRLERGGRDWVRFGHQEVARTEGRADAEHHDQPRGGRGERPGGRGLLLLGPVLARRCGERGRGGGGEGGTGWAQQGRLPRAVGGHPGRGGGPAGTGACRGAEGGGDPGEGIEPGRRPGAGGAAGVRVDGRDLADPGVQVHLVVVLALGHGGGTVVEHVHLRDRQGERELDLLQAAPEGERGVVAARWVLR